MSDIYSDQTLAGLTKFLEETRDLNLHFIGKHIADGHNVAAERRRDVIETLEKWIEEIKRLREALEKISSPTQSTNLLWWQIESREALGSLSATDQDKEKTFLGRCQHCLDNALANSTCHLSEHPDCLVGRARRSGSATENDS